MTPSLRLSFLTSALVALCAPVSAACPEGALDTARTIEIGPRGTAIGLQSYPSTLKLEDHEVVLTFDDGPTPATTPKVLDALGRECVKATFFLIGRNAAGAPALVRREIAEGHSVGHHSNTHPAKTLRLMDAAAAKADIEAGVAAVEKAGYGAASDKPHTPFFRFPGFADTPELLSWLEARGFTVFGSDLWASDWQEMTPQAELDLVMSRLDKAGRGIVLFHDSRPSTAAMLPDFLRRLKEGGYRVVHIVPGAGPTPLTEPRPDWTSTTEPIVRRNLGRMQTRGPEPAAKSD